MLGLLRLVKRFNVLFSITQTAASLWDYGEDALAERALEMPEADLRAVQRIAATYEDPTYPLPIEGQRITHNHVNAIAAVAYLEPFATDGAYSPPAREGPPGTFRAPPT